MPVMNILTQVALVLVAGIVLKAVGDKIRVPYIVLLILAGTFLATYGWVNLDSLQPLPELIRTLALIIIVFNASFYINLRDIRKESRTIVGLATFGVLITASIIALTTFQLLYIPVIAAAFIGALLSGTDPAVISSSEKKARSKVLTILRAESIFNQPLTIIIPLFLLDMVLSPELALLNVPMFFVLLFMGFLFGLIGYFVGQEILNAAKGKHEEIIALVIVLLVYVLAENLYGSGILAVATCSLLLTSSKIPGKRSLGEFNKELAFLFTVLVFLFLGAEFTFGELAITRAEIFAVIVALFLGRLISTLIVLFKSDLTFRERLTVGLVSPKGIAPAALAPLILATGIVGSEVVVKLVFYAIILSIFFSLLFMSLLVEKEEKEKKPVKEQLREMKEKREKEKGNAV